MNLKKRLMMFITRKNKKNDLFSFIEEREIYRNHGFQERGIGFIPENPPSSGLHICSEQVIPDNYDMGSISEGVDFVSINPPLELQRQRQAEFNEHYSNREIAANELVILDSEGWRVVNYTYDVRGNDIQYTLENVNTQERITIHRNIPLEFPLFQGVITRSGDYQYQFTWGINAENKSKKPLMDRKYPHVCFQCKNLLQYKHVFEQARKKYDICTVYVNSFYDCDKKVVVDNAKKVYTFEKQFKKWWKCKVIQFLCCSCYNKATLLPNQSTRINRVDMLGGYSMAFRDELPEATYHNPEGEDT